MKKQNITVNAILNAVRLCLSAFFPLVTYPYVLRILGVARIGVVTYTSSIVSYFMILASLGMGTYAIREGAKCRNNKKEFQKFCNEIFSTNVLFTIISYAILLYTVCFLNGLKQYGLLISIQSLAIIFETFSVSWMNSIFEDYVYITVRSIAAYLTSLLMTFLFIHSPEDYLKYAFIQILPQGISCVSNWIYCKRYVRFKLTIHLNLPTHLKPILYFFANTIAVSIYVNIDNVMLGWILGNESVGIYTAAVKIYTVLKNVLSSIYIVAIPRFAELYGQKHMGVYRNLFSGLISTLALIILPICTGLACSAEALIGFIAGESYNKGTLPLQILSLSLMFALFGGIITACINIPLGREKENMIATIGSAFINFSLNLIMIPKLGAAGAAITTTFSELFVFMYCFIRIPNKERIMDFKSILSNISISIVECFMIIVCFVIIKQFILDSFMNMVLLICSSVSIYALILTATKNPVWISLVEKMRRFLVLARKK